MLSEDYLRSVMHPRKAYSYRQLEMDIGFTKHEISKLRWAVSQGLLTALNKTRIEKTLYFRGWQVIKVYKEAVINGGKLEVSKN